MKLKIAVLPGDGIGPEVTNESIKVLNCIAKKFNHEVEMNEGLVGAIAIDHHNNPYPDETHNLCLESDAILFGAIGDPKYDNDPSAKIRPEQGLLKMRQKLGLFANVRPTFTFPSLINKSPLKKERIELKIMKLNRLDLSSTIKGVRIIMDEGGDNTYYVNVSSGSKIQAVACTMACMMFNEKNNLIPYYVQPKKYFAYNGEQMSTGLEKIIDLPQYNIKTPDKKLIQTLQIIKKNDNRITKSNLAKAVDDKKIIEIGSKDNYEQARFTSLDKNIIKPLKDNWKFVKEDKIGRTRWVEITPEGKNILDILDDDEMSL